MSGTVRLIINGMPRNAPIPVPTSRVSALVEKTLIDGGHTGQPPVDWELRTADGSLIDTGITIRDAHIVDGATLYLNPRAGWGGAVELYPRGPISVFELITG